MIALSGKSLLRRPLIKRSLNAGKSLLRGMDIYTHSYYFNVKFATAYIILFSYFNKIIGQGINACAAGD